MSSLSIEEFVIAERPEEFDEILHICLREVSLAVGRPIYRISDEAAHRLEGYAWPGNLRQLCQVLRYAVLSSKQGEISALDLPNWFCGRQSAV